MNASMLMMMMERGEERNRQREVGERNQTCSFVSERRRPIRKRPFFFLSGKGGIAVWNITRKSIFILDLLNNVK